MHWQTVLKLYLVTTSVAVEFKCPLMILRLTISAAVFLDSDLETVSKMLCRIFWDEDDLRDVWTHIPPHPIQAQQPNGDRHLIKSTKILQQITLFEDMIGVEFTHVRLLAQAFCTRSASFNLITL